MAEKTRPGNIKTYRGNLSLEWYGKEYSIIQGKEEDNSPGMVPPPRLNWVNKDGALFYEIDESQGKGVRPVWVHRGDIRVHEARPLVHVKTYTAVPNAKAGSLGLEGDSGWDVEESDAAPEDPLSGNMLIKGDNLLALNTLKKLFAGRPDSEKVKCIYIDPPYNTETAFDYYDDNLSHSEWLTMIRDRISILRDLLMDEGFFCCQADDSEAPYLKLLLDEVFGRDNLLTTFYVKVRYSEKTLSEKNDFQKLIEQCFIYAKNKSMCSPNKESEEYTLENFCWEITEISKGSTIDISSKKVTMFHLDEYSIEKKEFSIDLLKETWATGSVLKVNASGKFFRDYLAPRKLIDGLGCLYKVEGIGDDGIGYRYFSGPKRASATKGKFFSGVPNMRRKELNEGESLKEKPILNYYDMADAYGNCRHEGNAEFRGGKKPEIWIDTILRCFSDPDDLVLDCFSGSGTTPAVAHKMDRRWIAVEIGNHCDTHIKKRQQNVLTGYDQTGISEARCWTGGGAFSYYHLGDSILKLDEAGWADLNWEAGRVWLEGAILSAYDFRPVELAVGGLGLERLSAGLREVRGGAEAAIVSLCTPEEGEARRMMGRAEWERLYAAARKLGSKVYLFTNRGLELAEDLKPDELTVVRVPDALCTPE